MSLRLVRQSSPWSAALLTPARPHERPQKDLEQTSQQEEVFVLSSGEAQQVLARIRQEAMNRRTLSNCYRLSSNLAWHQG